MDTVPSSTAGDGSCSGAVTIVASAGGIRALIELLGGLSATYPLPIFVAQHLPLVPSSLDRILSSRCILPVKWAEPGSHGASEGVHLARPGTGIRLTTSGIEIDLLSSHPTSWLATGDRMIKSVFSVFGSRTIAIVLSGMLPAGVEGVRLVRLGGGITMAQDRRSSRDFEMPSAAIDLGKAEIVCSPSQMADILTLLAEDWRAGRKAASARFGRELS